MNILPLVSIIIPTKNSQKYLKDCMESVKEQTYKKIEVILVEKLSTDKTVAIASKYTKKIYNKGAERSSQRKFGALKARGKYVFFVDSDMQLSPAVVAESVGKMERDRKIKALIIPEESIGEGFWAECKRFRISFYVGIGVMEATRFFERDAFLKLGG